MSASRTPSDAFAMSITTPRGSGPDAPHTLDRLTEALRAHEAKRRLKLHDIGAVVRALRDEI